VIYFLQPVGGGPVKIGCSANVNSRHKQLETHYGCELVLLATMRGGRATEKMIHAEFGHLRIGRTEQFRPAPELIAFIGKPLLVGINPDTVEARNLLPSRSYLSVQSESSPRRTAIVTHPSVEESP
jgi:hypothetical protein